MTNKIFKSVHLTNYYHKTSGGISTAYNHLLEAANRHQRFVRLIVPGEEEGIEEIGKFGKIYYIKAEPFPFFDKRYRIILPPKYIKNDSPIRQILIDEMPDMIEICDKYSISLLAGLIRKGFLAELKRPMLVHLSCERMDDNIAVYISKGKIGKWFARRFMSNFNYPMFDFYTTNSEYTAGEIFDAMRLVNNKNRSEKFFNFCSNYFKAAKMTIENRVFINKCGVDLKTFTIIRQNKIKRKELLDELKIPEFSNVLLYAGRISPEKNIEILVEIMKKLADDKNNNFQILIAGDGPKKEWLEKELEKIVPNRYRFLGHIVDKERLADFYANVDVFIHPNPREPFGIGPLEAMASGTPVIAPNSGGLLSYANEENTWLIKPTAGNFANSIKEIIKSSSKRQAKIENALETVKKFTWEIATDCIFNNYDQMFSDFKLNYSNFVYLDEKQENENFSLMFRENK